MPQELHVLKCYQCDTFQVHIVKKASQWQCKMCGEKQSIKQVYARGSGKECRLYVQQLNQARLERNLLQIDNCDLPYGTPSSTTETKLHNTQSQNLCGGGGWDDFVTTNSGFSEPGDNDSKYTFERPAKKRKLKQLTSVAENNRKTSRDENLISTSPYEPNTKPLVQIGKHNYSELTSQIDIFNEVPVQITFKSGSNVLNTNNETASMNSSTEKQESQGKWIEFQDTKDDIIESVPVCSNKHGFQSLFQCDILQNDLDVIFKLD